MNGWQYFAAALVCLCGMLSFLRTVACAIDAADGVLRGLEDRLGSELKAAS